MGLSAIVGTLAASIVISGTSAAAQDRRLKDAPGRMPVHSAGLTAAQGGQDSVWNGVLIGAAAGAVVGMAIAPPAYCGANDTECATIVRVAIGLPAIGIGALAGGLIDRFSARGPSRSPGGYRTVRARVTPLLGRRAAGVSVDIRLP